MRQKPVVPQPNASDLYASLPVITSFEPGKIWKSASTPKITKEEKCSSNEEVSRPIQLTKIGRTIEPILVTSKKLNSNKTVRWNDKVQVDVIEIVDGERTKAHINRQNGMSKKERYLYRVVQQISADLRRLV